MQSVSPILIAACAQGKPSGFSLISLTRGQAEHPGGADARQRRLACSRCRLRVGGRPAHQDGCLSPGCEQAEVLSAAGVVERRDSVRVEVVTSAKLVDP